MSQDSGAPPPGSWRAMVMEALNRAEAGEEAEDERPPEPRSRSRLRDIEEPAPVPAPEPARPAEPADTELAREARSEDRPRRRRRHREQAPHESEPEVVDIDAATGRPVEDVTTGRPADDVTPGRPVDDAAARQAVHDTARDHPSAETPAEQPAEAETMRPQAPRPRRRREAPSAPRAPEPAGEPLQPEPSQAPAAEDPPRAPSAQAQDQTQAPPQAHSQPRAQKADPVLTSLLRFTQHFARPVSEADIRLAVPIGEEGMSLQEFRRAAQRIGYKTGSAEIDAESAGELPTPFLAHTGDGGRCLSVLSRDGIALVAYDPLSAEVSLLGPEELAASFDQAILIKPENEFEVRSHDWRTMLWGRMRGVVMELLLASFVINLFALAAPLFIMTVYNKIVGQKALDTLTILALGMGTVYAFDLLLRILRGYISTHTGARMEALIGAEVMHHLLRLPYKHFESTPTGMIAERLRQMDTIRAFFTGQMPMTLVDLLFVFVFLTVLFFMSPIIGFIVLGAMPIFVILSASFHATQKKLTEENFLGQAAKTSALSEVVHNALTVKSLALEADVERRWEQRLGLSAWTGYRAGNLANAIAVASQVLQQAIGLLIIVFGARQIIAEEMSIGALIAANILATRALAPMRQVVSAWHQVQEVRAAFSRINDIMSEPTEAGPGELGAGMALKGDITFEDVTFRYAEGIPPVIEDVSFDVSTGQMLGIIGPSGSGKSTLAKLLQGLYEPDAGRVLIDGTDIQHISPAALRRQIGVVPQEVQLFAGTVRENISMGVADKDPARIVAVSKFVGAHDFIQHLPKGYDTILTERGGGLSAGQRQLLSIARALIRNPRILVLDEATSALDPVTEERFMKNLRRASRGRTIVVISHRMGPVSIADKVGLVIGGQLERVGPPREIIAFARTRMAENAREAQG